MRVPKIIAIALLLIAGPSLVESCCYSDSCGCTKGNFEAHTFDIDDMSLSIQRFPLGTSGSVPVPSTFSTIALQVQLDMTYALLTRTLGVSLYACSPPPPIANQKITAITIKSNNALATNSDSFAVGEDLSSIFKVYSSSYWKHSVEVLFGQEYLDEYISFNSEAVLSGRQTHTFTITITLDDARVFTMTSAPLDLN